MWPLTAFKKLSRKQAQGRHWEHVARRHLEQHGLTFVEANFTCKGGELDLIMRDGAMLVFVEVRQRADRDHGGAAASITPVKQARMACAAQVYLMRYRQLPPCRFDVVAIDGGQLDWLKNCIGF